VIYPVSPLSKPTRRYEPFAAETYYLKCLAARAIGQDLFGRHVLDVQKCFPGSSSLKRHLPFSFSDRHFPFQNLLMLTQSPWPVSAHCWSGQEIHQTRVFHRHKHRFGDLSRSALGQFLSVDVPNYGHDADDDEIQTNQIVEYLGEDHHDNAENETRYPHP
jgi:hypothetical protein